MKITPGSASLGSAPYTALEEIPIPIQESFMPFAAR
jgi:hypothetical protein